MEDELKTDLQELLGLVSNANGPAEVANAKT